MARKRKSQADRTDLSPPARGTRTASESLVALTGASFAALRTQLHRAARDGGAGMETSDAEHLAATLDRLEAGYRELLRRT